MMGTVVDWLSGAMLLVGAAFVFIGGLGALRMPDLFTRLHATSLTDTLGALLVLGGLMIQGGISLVTLKLAAIAIFLLFTSPVSAYALAHAALLAGQRPILEDDDGAGDP